MASALTVVGALLTALATLYALAALLCRPRTWRPPRGGVAPVPVSVLKPLCGAEPNLERKLASLCRQTHPCYQLVFGVRDPDDPAAATVARLARRFPELDIRLVADPRVHGSNLKVSNLINMRAAARHPWLVLADSDIGVGPDYLERVSAPLAEPGTGIVTCLYRGVAAGGFWSRLGVLFIDSWFAPSVRVASRGGGSAFGFGATIALRAGTLDRIGGFEAIKDRLADDFWLGELTRRQGLATVLSEVEVTTDVTERSLAALWARERRWMQTIRSLNPPGYAFCFVTFTLPMLALGLWLAPAPWNWAVALPGLGARLLLHWRAQPHLAALPLVPLRDGLLLVEWLSAFAGSTTRWRGHLLRVDGRRATGAVPAALEKT
ncbi:bacteriohopanetetrol glucosamine biosynthesis glycosyltransferase HpnI [Massilia litorea]|uniref:Bacteriohopanetetrol glucosamine biosynthesis glycosyltransferase HpnI n=1 Tax=Massilia litorea TaxID=2769491 RepID=A0A7L9TZU3_9BURK|nr:bacteriohopanetetrol glucosamine biosynthesis glycosyltransferase HpnI [Massilia litorea]QOL48200.1 bacteriohopanetetrol glucosamine biosynthesis glycosyltransferase HpnI [Massilia litorea]